MPPTVFTTATLPAGQQFEAWCDRYGPLVDTARAAPRPHPFPARLEVRDAHGLALTRAHAPPVRFARSAAALRRLPLDHWALVQPTSGRITVRAGDGVTHVPAGVTYVSALGRTLEGEREARDWLVLFLPRERFEELAPLLDAAHGRLLDRGAGLLVGDLVRALAGRLATMGPADVAAAAEALKAMLRVALTPAGRAPDEATAMLDVARRERIERIVRARLHEPDLSPERLARLCGLSRSSLYRVLGPEGGAAALIRRRRLEAAGRALADPDDRRPVHAIATALAFADAAGFSRAFKAAFGRRPQEVRAAALAAAGGGRTDNGTPGQDPGRPARSGA